MAGLAQDDSAASFIGALISLTSRSNMRYQGVLSNIDAAQATLALEKGTLAVLTQSARAAPKDVLLLQDSRRKKCLATIKCMTTLCSAPRMWSICVLMTPRRKVMGHTGQRLSRLLR